MSVEFIGRRQEIEVLAAAYRQPESAFIPIYGRRRVGKSELILQFLKGKRGIYFLGKKAPAALQIREFLAEAASILEEPLLAGLAAEQWRDALGAVTSRWSGQGKLILVFDEFQWTVAASPELPSILQEKWDREWKRSGRVMLILCGSYVGFMEREILGRKSPLFGRRTAQILLRPFGYREAAEFHPAFSLVDRVRTYFICGGIPFYLQFFSDRKSIEANIAASLLDEYAPLFREPDFLLREELREVENYYAALLAVASGFSSSQAISQRAGVSSHSLHYYLQQLAELGYLRKRHPLVDGKRSPRQVRYGLADPLLKFWFRFVFPNTSHILHMGAKRTLRDRIRPDLDAYFGTCFERLCQEALPHLYRGEGVAAAFEVGEYWSKTAQIDVVGLRDDGWIDLGECRWRARLPTPARVEEELERKVREYPNPKNSTIGRRVFVRKKPASVPRSKRVSWHDLDDLYR